MGQLSGTGGTDVVVETEPHWRAHGKDEERGRPSGTPELPAFLVVRYIIFFFFFPPMPAHRGPADISTDSGNTDINDSNSKAILLPSWPLY